MPSAFASHWTLDPEVRFLNHGSFGACPRAVLEAQAELRARLEAEPVRFFLREAPELAEQARGTLAGLVGAQPADLAFVSNATEAVNAILRSLELSADDALLVCDQSYNACANAARFVADQAGARVDVAALPFPLASADEAFDAIMDAVRDDTKLALLDWISSPTGLVLPIHRLVAALRERGVLTLVDAAHAVGQVPMDITALDADFVTSNCHKWMCTPKGSAFLWVRGEHQHWVRPVVISHGANAPPSERSRFQVEFGWTGTADPTAMLTLPLAFETLSSLRPGGLDAHMAANRELALWARDLLCDTLGVPAPQPDDMVASLAAVPLPDAPSVESRDALATSPLQDRLLFDHGVEVPIVTWPAPPRRLVRVSAQAYNDRDDYQALAAALPALLAEEATG
jgi:isopenicillin-N epimerase